MIVWRPVLFSSQMILLWRFYRTLHLSPGQCDDQYREPMNNHLIVHKTLKWELMIRWSQCNDVTMSMMLKISVWWSTIWSLCGDNDNHFHPGIIIEMLTTFCLRSSNHPGMTSDGRRCHGESTVILDDDDENSDVKGSDYFSIMTWWQQWLNKAQGRQIQWWHWYSNDKEDW